MDLVLLAVVPPLEREIVFFSRGLDVDAAADVKIVVLGIVVLREVRASLRAGFGRDANPNFGIVPEFVFKKGKKINQLTVHTSFINESGRRRHGFSDE
jgi:hypothetical protein